MHHSERKRGRATVSTRLEIRIDEAEWSWIASHSDEREQRVAKEDASWVEGGSEDNQLGRGVVVDRVKGNQAERRHLRRG